MKKDNNDPEEFCMDLMFDDSTYLEKNIKINIEAPNIAVSYNLETLT